MIDVKTVLKTWTELGPKQKSGLQELAKAHEAAKSQVKALEELRAKRSVELAHGQLSTQVYAGADPGQLATAQALAQATAIVIGQIDKDMAAAQKQATQAGRALSSHIDALATRRRRIVELEQDIAALTAQRDKLQEELSS